MLDHVAIQPSTRGVRVVGALLVAVLALVPLAGARGSHSRCRATALSAEQDPQPTIRRRTPGLNHEYLQRELR